jgi:serine phosphatase RsbU (regulator of sigma subunit)
VCALDHLWVVAEQIGTALNGWQLATLYQPAQEVGGDFNGFIPLTDGRLGVVLGDGADKWMPPSLLWPMV